MKDDPHLPLPYLAWGHLLLLGFLCFVFARLPVIAAQPVSLRDVLSPEDFRRAGLDKLTAEELKFLDARLATAGILPPLPARSVSPDTPAPVEATTGTLPRGEAAFGNETQLRVAVEKLQKVPSGIQSRIVGAFYGWEGKTEFHLENGQVWRQAEDGRFAVNLTNPVVVIERGFMGAFYLHVDGYGTRVKVRRVK